VVDIIKRIVYCEPEDLPSLPSDQAEDVGSDLPVRAVGDDVLLNSGIKFSILYFSREDYDQTVRRLTHDQLDEVITFRKEKWSRDAAGHSFRWLEDQLRKCLTLNALALKSPQQPSLTALLGQNFEHTIARLGCLKGAPPLGLLLPCEVLEVALENDVRLSMEYQDLPIPEGPDLSGQRSQRARAIARMMVELGDDAFVKGLPFVIRRRGVNVIPLHKTIRAELEEEGDPLADWSGGTVIPWPHDNAHGLVRGKQRAKDVSIHVLFLDADEYENIAAASTQAQKERDFEERMVMAKTIGHKRIGDSVEDHINGLMTDQIVYISGLRDLFADLDQTSLSEGFDQFVRQDVSALLEMLQKSPSWISDPEEGGKDALGLLKTTEQRVQKSAKFFSSLNIDDDWVEIGPDYKAFLDMGDNLAEITKYAGGK